MNKYRNLPKALIAVAHPDHRDRLTRDAVRLGLL